MSIDRIPVRSISQETHYYPLSHWNELSQFIIGEERDPNDIFGLADDDWDVRLYAAPHHPAQENKYFFRFGHLRSFLKPYVKWYCYQRMLGKRTKLSLYDIRFPFFMSLTDLYLVNHSFQTIDAIASSKDFAALWAAQLKPLEVGKEIRTEADVKRQYQSRPFWLQLRAQFGAPQVVPPIAPYKKRSPTEIAFDESEIIPLPVLRQFANKLALHREGKEKLNRYHHLRLCVLVLTLALGRRINEILTAPRCTGPDGPLKYYPAKNASSKEALWFEFKPNKGGPENLVYVSPEWEEVVFYCVRELIRYSDEVRDGASFKETGLLILISPWNQTGGTGAVLARPIEDLEDIRFPRMRRATATQPKSLMPKRATALSYLALYTWLNDHEGWTEDKTIPGILRQWNITENGLPNGQIYQLHTHQARHTRQSAIASDPNVSPLSRQRDLNHRNRDMQFAYQHQLQEQNKALLSKAMNGQMIGPAVQWLRDIYQGSDQGAQFRPGSPSLLTPRLRNIMKNNPLFLQFHRVYCGYCVLPQGPEGCREYMNCLEVADCGCQWFLTDPENELFLIQITQRVDKHRKKQQESAAAGHTVQAEKYEALARRAGTLQEKVFQSAGQDLKERLKKRKRELDEDMDS